MDSTDYVETDDVQEIVGDEWYEQNLELAAELGKALLEKNRELESQVNQLQTVTQEQETELQFLKCQLEAAKAMTESKNRIYEEVDKTAQDLENSNKKMMMEARADRQKIEKQAAIIHQLEDKADDLQKKLDDFRTSEKKVTKKIPEKRRTASLNRLSLGDTKNQSYDYYGNLDWTYSDDFRNIPLNPYEFEIRKLQDSVQHLKIQQSADRRKLENLEVDCSVLMEENQSLGKKVKVLESKLSEAIVVQYELEQLCLEHHQLHQPSVIGSDIAADKQERIKKPETKMLSEIEHDDPELKSEARAVKLESGSSLYSSSESINKVATDVKEIQVGDDASLCLLDELESQYKSIFTKYQSLIQIKGKTKDKEEEAYRHLAHKEVQTLLHITLNKDFYQDTSSVPPYKALFKDIFLILRKNRIEEDSEREKNNSLNSSVACSSVDEMKESAGDR